MYKRYSKIIVRDWKDDVLMGKRNDSGLWTQPGGAAKTGECPYTCAFREFLEETGVSLKSLKLVNVSINKDKNMIYVFEGQLPDEYEFDTSHDPDKEVDNWLFIDPNTVKEQLHVPIEYNYVLQYWINN